jgi:hypothetical protein
MTINYSKQVLLKRGNTHISSTYIGPLSELTYDTDLITLRVHDGVTLGGSILPSASDKANAISILANITTIINQGATEIANLHANANSQQTQINSLLGNVAGANAAIVTANTAMKGYVDGQILTIIGGAPGALDTLNELANALGNNASFSTTITNSLATLTSNAAVQSGLITDTNTAIGTANTAMKGYVDGQISTVTNSVTGANAAIVTANTAMKGYADAITTAWTANAGAQAVSIASIDTNIANVRSTTSTFTGTIAGNVLTVTGCNPGVIAWNQYIEGAGVADDTFVTTQLTYTGGRTGGNGTYRITPNQNIGPIAMYVTTVFVDSSIKLAEGHGLFQQDEHDLDLYNLLIGIKEEEATIHIGDINTNGLSLTNDKEYKIDSALNLGTYMAVAKVDATDNVILASGNAVTTKIRVGSDNTNGFGYAEKFFNGGQAHIPVGLRIGNNINAGNYGAALEVCTNAYSGASFASYKGSSGDPYGSFLFGSRFGSPLEQVGLPTAVSPEDWLMEFGAGAWDGAGLNGGGELAWRVDGTVTTGVSNPSRVEIYVTPVGSVNQTLGLVIDSKLTTKTYGRLQIGASVPATSKGATGDKANMMAVGGGFLYVCITDYTTGSADIWTKTALTGGTW